MPFTCEIGKAGLFIVAFITRISEAVLELIYLFETEYFSNLYCVH